MLTEGLILAIGWLIGSGAFGGKKSTPPTPPKGPLPSTPSKVPWPESGTPEEQLAAHREQLKRDAAAARARVKPGDTAAELDIAAKEAARQKALDDMQRDIERSKGPKA